MRGWPSCLLQSAGGEANRILLASALSSMRIICPNRVSRHDWIIAVSLGCFVSLRTSSFRTNWYHVMPSSIHRHQWSSASILIYSTRQKRKHNTLVHSFAKYWRSSKLLISNSQRSHHISSVLLHYLEMSLINISKQQIKNKHLALSSCPHRVLVQ